MKKSVFVLLISLLSFQILKSQQVNVSELIYPLVQKNFNAAPRDGVTPMSIRLWDNYMGGGPSSYGSLLEIYGRPGHMVSQLYFGGWDNSRIWYREAFYAQGQWNEWRYLLDSKNDIRSSGNLIVTGTGNHDINGSIYAKQRINISDYGSNDDLYLRFNDKAALTHFNTLSDNTLYINYDWTEAEGFHSDFSGVQINGNTTFTGNASFPFTKYFGFGPWAEDNTRLLIHHNGTHGYIDYMDNLHFRANKNWISALTLYGDGTVGIGFNTTYTAGDYRTQGYKLAVNGGILCEEIEVLTDVPDADYVFKADYKLKTLPDLESFIKEHRHLPDIPSAEQFKKDGYKVGDMDEMLLRKVEELSLYIIEQNKMINELKNELEKLNQRNLHSAQ